MRSLLSARPMLCLALCTRCAPPPEPAPDFGCHEVAISVAAEVQIRPVRGVADLVAVIDAPGTSFAWERNGEAAWLGPRVPAGQVWPGDVWTVTATPSDRGPSQATVVIPAPRGGNVLVLLLDDVGVDQVGAYGLNPDAPPTPTLDRLAEEGIRFDQAYASPVCSPSRAILLTGRLPRRTGVGWILDVGDRDYALPHAAVTIPEALRLSRGLTYADSAVGKWHLAGRDAPGYRTHPNDAGFSWYAGALGNPAVLHGGYDRWQKTTNGVTEESTTYMTTDTVDDALARIAALPEPWFLYVAFNAAHTPLTPPPAALVDVPVHADSPEGVRYDAIVEALDTEIQRLFEGIPADVLARTTTLVLGDNGTSEVGVDPPFDPGRAKHSPYEGGLRIPLIVTGPHVARPGSHSDALVSVADVFPTVMELAGVPVGGPGRFGGLSRLDAASSVDLDGCSLMPHLAADPPAGRELLYMEAFRPNGALTTSRDMRIVRDRRYKLIRRTHREEELYDLTRALEDGPDLLSEEPPSDETQAAWRRLSAALDEMEQRLFFEAR